MTHANAPCHTGDRDIVAVPQIVHRADLPSGLQAVHYRLKGFNATTGDNGLVYSFATGHGQHLLVNGAVFIADKIIRSIFSGHLNAIGPGAHRNNAGRSPQDRACHRHQANRADAHHQHGVAKLHVRQFHAMKTGRNHVRKHTGIHNVHALRQQCQIAVSVIDVEILRKDAVLDVGEFPSCQHSVRVHGIAGLRLQGTPVGGNGRDQDPITGLEIPHLGAYLHHLSTAFVAQDHVVPLTNSTLPDGVYV